ncbi:hypothetical protein AB0G02_26180, partial [Actinosynnema sp. NPDC023658]|uniref:hypothetical protein n=1 Tax=Actinosynnema sp. NPDC023658 TaxID=3155465 RepID=UPI0034117313
MTIAGPDVEIPRTALTSFVLQHAEEHGDAIAPRPASRPRGAPGARPRPAPLPVGSSTRSTVDTRFAAEDRPRW